MSKDRSDQLEIRIQNISLPDDERELLDLQANLEQAIRELIGESHGDIEGVEFSPDSEIQSWVHQDIDSRNSL